MTAKTLTALAALMLALPLTATAQDTTRPAMPTLDFATADANGDGGITSDEWATYAAALMQGRMAEGIATRADALLTAGDANGDGMLNRDELVTALTARMDEMREQRGERMRGHDGEGRHGWGRHHDGERAEGRGEHRGEHRGERGERGMGRAFSRIDQDDNGIVSPEELALAQAMIERMGQRHGRN